MTPAPLDLAAIRQLAKDLDAIDEVSIDELRAIEASRDALAALCDLVEDLARALEEFDASAEHTPVCMAAYDVKLSCSCGLGPAIINARAVLARVRGA